LSDSSWTTATILTRRFKFEYTAQLFQNICRICIINYAKHRLTLKQPWQSGSGNNAWRRNDSSPFQLSNLPSTPLLRLRTHINGYFALCLHQTHIIFDMDASLNKRIISLCLLPGTNPTQESQN